ncbi:MAG: patatin-like phospholipase family protein [Pseudomonadota bacterium]|nr:patatin-like phospholipase family protein [Pseudomonadota bacterium]
MPRSPVRSEAAQRRPRRTRAAKSQIKTINLALQGGGSHGAFTWGVLDALLEDGRLRFDGVSAASSGAMNAVAMAEGLAKAHERGLESADALALARRSLLEFWEAVARYGTLAQSMPMVGAASLMNLWSQWLSPSQMNPLGINPLRDLLQSRIDFARIGRQQALKLFIAATNVRTGKPRVFTGAELSADVVMASACLPTVFKAVEIDGEHYWDGGYSGNPAIYPLIYDTATRDVLLVHLHPLEYQSVPVTHDEIMQRVDEITFNACLVAELRVIEFVRHLILDSHLERKGHKHLLMHRINGGLALNRLGASRSRADGMQVRTLFALGRQAGARWLADHFEDVGVCDSLEVFSA